MRARVIFSDSNSKLALIAWDLYFPFVIEKQLEMKWKSHIAVNGRLNLVVDNLSLPADTVSLSNFHFFLFIPDANTRYNISWTVDSHTPIEEFKLYFRRLPQGHEIDNSIDQQQSAQHHNVQSHRSYGNLMHWSRNDWRDVVLPSVPLSHHYTQGMSYMIRGLDPDQQYEARVQAR